MTLVMTLLVRDEEDIVRHTIEHHLALGVDHVIATDNRSVDGTAEVLRAFEREGLLTYVYEDDDDYSQHRWVTRMARMAFDEHAADWVLHADADEFWLPTTHSDLPTAFTKVGPEVSVVEAPRFNFLCVPGDEPFLERMTVRHTVSASPEDGWPLGPKVAHRGHPHVAVAQGNHAASWPGVGKTVEPGLFEIMHFPTRSPEQLARKVELGGAAYERNTELPEGIGDRWRQMLQAQRDGTFDELVAPLVHDDPDEVAEGLREGRYVEDTRVRDLAGRLQAEHRIRRIGDEVDYADQAEARILRLMRTADDRSDGSEELVGRVSDWATRYHLSPRRTHLLQPLQLRPGLRVLDVGAGSGAIARHLGEAGCEVVALEGNIQRAKAAAVRCAELADVQILCGSLADYAAQAEELGAGEGFDAVFCIGVLEYSGYGLRSRDADDAARAALDAMAGLLKPDGLLVLAIENRLGLKYLLGYREDHHDDPFIGVEGYPGSGIRTWGRVDLGALLAGAGLERQRWLFPFPDYKLPGVITDEAAYAQPDAGRLIDQLVRQPSSGEPEPPLRLADERRAHRSFVDAGLGPDVANSFLVVAGRPGTADPASLVPPDEVAWHLGGPRRKAFRRSTTVVADADGRRSRSEPTFPEVEPESTWLEHHARAERPYVEGDTLEQLFLEACADGSEEEAGAVLRRWRAHLAEHRVPLEEVGDRTHPFLRLGAARVLEPQLLDCNLRNFVVDAEGGITFVDDELVAPPGVDEDLVVLRSLFELARDVITTGAPHPWPVGSTVGSLTRALGRTCDLEVTPGLLSSWQASEADLLGEVVGHAPSVVAQILATDARISRVDLEVPQDVPFAQIGRDLRRVDRERAAAEAERARLESELADVRAWGEDLVGQIESWEARWATLERFPPFKAYRKLRRG